MNRKLSKFAKHACSLACGVAFMAIANAAEDPYIESLGTSAINTGYRMTAKSRVEVDFALTEQTENARIYGSDTQEPTLQSVLYVSGGATHFVMLSKHEAGGTSRYKAGTDLKRHMAIHDFRQNKVQLVTDGKLELDTTTGLTLSEYETATRPLVLFARYNNAYMNGFECKAKARIYGVKIYEDGALVRNFIPCKRSGEVACFKDTCTGVFVGGENAYAFTAGGDVPSLPDDGYVSTTANPFGKNDTDGQLYFDTGYTVTANTAVEIDCAFAKNYPSGGTGLGYLFYAGSEDANLFNCYFNADGLAYCIGGENWKAIGAGFGAPTKGKDVRRTYKFDGQGDKAILSVMTAGSTNYTKSVTVVKSNYSTRTLKLSSGSGGTGSYSPLKIYGCRIYESGVLVRDFVPYVKDDVPGLFDLQTRKFSANKDNRGLDTKVAYGGMVAGEKDAYIQSKGSTLMDTLYKMKGNSRVEVDFALWDTPAAQWRIFGTDAATEGSLMTYLYIDGDLHWTMSVKYPNKNNNLYTTVTADTKRHTAVIDLGNKWMGMTTGSTTNLQTTIAYDYSGIEAVRVLPLFGRGGTYSKTRIYSVRFYEKEADGMKLVHEYLPYDGSTLDGFYDTVTGDIISKDSTFTYNGIGHDGGDLTATVLASGTEIEKDGDPVTLTAYAPGATSFRWLRDGEPIEGGTDGVLEAEWTHSNRTNVYQAVSVYADFYGVPREGTPSVGNPVVSKPTGLIMYVR